MWRGGKGIAGKMTIALIFDSFRRAVIFNAHYMRKITGLTKDGY